MGIHGPLGQVSKTGPGSDEKRAGSSGRGEVGLLMGIQALELSNPGLQ